MRIGRTLFFSSIILVLLAVSMYGALADPVPPSLQQISTGTRTFSGVSNISAQGGNVTEIRIDALTVTKTWQGYYGNITGNIHLDDAVNNSFYIWGNASGVSGEVFASRNSTVNWVSINCTNASQRSVENTYLGVTASDGDSVTNTFNSTYHPTFIVGATTIQNSTCYSTNAYVNGTSQNSSFYQILLSDQYNNTVYTTLIENDQYAYNGRRADFQLMVGENEHDGNVGPTLYYFFVELS